LLALGVPLDKVSHFVPRVWVLVANSEREDRSEKFLQTGLWRTVFRTFNS
jgi:hypothetical protein